MKKLLMIVVLGLFLITPSQANDIRDLEIEGMSIGDSLLNYYKKEKIVNHLEKAYFYKDRKFADIFIESIIENSIYDILQISFKPEDNNYIIEGIAGQIDYNNNIHECLPQKDEIALDIEKFISETTQIERVDNKKHPFDKTGKSYTSSVYYFLENGSIDIQCYDWSKELEKKFADKLLVSFKSSDLRNFLMNEAY